MRVSDAFFSSYQVMCRSVFHEIDFPCRICFKKFYTSIKLKFQSSRVHKICSTSGNPGYRVPSFLFTGFQGHFCKITLTPKSTSVSVCFRGISRLPSAFTFLRWFKLAHISIQVCTFHDGCKQGIDQQIFNRKPISRKITHPQSWKLQAKLTGEKLKGWSNSREKNKLKTTIKIS